VRYEETGEFAGEVEYATPASGDVLRTSLDDSGPDRLMEVIRYQSAVIDEKLQRPAAGPIRLPVQDLGHRLFVRDLAITFLQQTLDG
jgi:hypothetical protein